MSTIQRQLPFSILGRSTALDKAKTKKDNLPPALVVLSPATQARLDAITGQYMAGTAALNTATVNSTQATAAKNAAQAVARMWCSHYYQALNNAIDRGEIPASARGFYGLPVDSGAVPDMDSEDRLKHWGNKVTTGDADRVAAGGVAITFPKTVTVALKVTDFTNALIAQSNLIDITGAKEEAVEALNPEADKVIKKVWDEVETAHNEETPESMRANAVEWGEVFIVLGEQTEITFKAVDSVTNAPIQDTEFKFLATGTVTKADDADSIIAKTRLVGNTVVEASHPDYVKQEQTITITEGAAMTVVFTMVHV